MVGLIVFVFLSETWSYGLATWGKLWPMNRKCATPNVLFGGKQVGLLYDSTRGKGAFKGLASPNAWGPRAEPSC